MIRRAIEKTRTDENANVVSLEILIRTTRLRAVTERTKLKDDGVKARNDQEIKTRIDGAKNRSAKT